MITDVQDDDDVIDNVDDKDGGDDDQDDQDEKEDDHHEEHHWLVVVDALGWVGEHGNIANWFIIKTGPHIFGGDDDDDGDDGDDSDEGGDGDEHDIEYDDEPILSFLYTKNLTVQSLAWSNMICWGFWPKMQ